jgi:hypothetical protein
MTKLVLLDNDVIVKVCCFNIGTELIDWASRGCIQLTMLTVAQYVVRGRIKRSTQLSDRNAAESTLRNVLNVMESTEPDDEELRMAAEFESVAQTRNLELDSGESQLLAILICRCRRLLLTGDKRAIHAIAEIAGEQLKSPRVACFEQLMSSILQQTNVEELRTKICREQFVDRATAICFACSSLETPVSSIFDGLRSYTNELRKVAQRVLLPSDDLSACIA